MFVKIRPYKKRGKEGWEADCTIHFPDGLPPFRRRKKTPEKTEKQAYKWGMSYAQKLAEKGRPWSTPEKQKAVQVMTFKEFVPIYMSRWIDEEDHTRSTYRLRDQQIQNYFLPKISLLRLDLITEDHLSEMKSSLLLKKNGARRSARQKNQLMALLSHMLEKAYEWKLVSGEPPKRQARAKQLPVEIEIYTDEELAYLADSARYRPQAYLVVMLGAEAGLRVAEMIGLRWTDVDLVRRRLVVRQQEQRVGEITPPKSKKPRPIPLTDSLHEALTQAQHLGERVLWFDGGPVIRSQVENWLRTAERRAKVIGAKSPHKLRHTFATRLLSKGANPKAVQALLGHASLQTTMGYLHLLPGEAEVAIRKLSGDKPETKETKVEK